MAFEVIKRIRGHDYRYRVESYRHPETGKVRAHWTYLGRAGDVAPAVRRAPRSSERTRERLLDALASLLDETDYASLTAGAVATRAGLAHGTFYRHFSDKRAALNAAVGRVREAFDAHRVALLEPVGDVTGERRRWRSWCRAILAKPAEAPGVLRAWYALAAADPAVAQARHARRSAAIAALVDYLGRLQAAGIADIEPQRTARAVVVVLDGAVRNVVIDRETIDDPTIDGLIQLLERAVFGDSSLKEEQ